VAIALATCALLLFNSWSVRNLPIRETIQIGGKIRTTADRDKQDALYAEASSMHGSAIRRLARGYETDPDRQRDLLQEMHLELWMSLKSFDGRCSLHTWVYRIAHNVGASHVVRSRRLASRLVDLETLEAARSRADADAQVDRRFSVAILLDMIHRLKPLDRQIILLYLEGEAAGPIAEVTGLSAANVATKIHRIKRVLKQQYLEGAPDART
jgi:RNA polymerase sigma-70 factor (ECF subfamily)